MPFYYYLPLIYIFNQKRGLTSKLHLFALFSLGLSLPKETHALFLFYKYYNKRWDSIILNKKILKTTFKIVICYITVRNIQVNRPQN